MSYRSEADQSRNDPQPTQSDYEEFYQWVASRLDDCLPLPEDEE
jgi:hypothetical protein